MTKELTKSQINDLERKCEERANRLVAYPIAFVGSVILVCWFIFERDILAFLVDRDFVGNDFEFDYGRIAIWFAVFVAPLIFAWHKYVQKTLRKRMGLDT